MAEVTLKNVTKIYEGGQVAAKDININVLGKEFGVLVGPSGCGKSTTLRMIAGLEEITSGELFIDNKKVNDVSPKDRDIAMVFQNYALYPHMTVYENMAFGLKLRKFPKEEIKKRVTDAAKILGLEDYLARKPKVLSGGQRQRVAVGRAIVRKPKVFLFDEPLSNLDAKLRVQMRTEISKLHQNLGATMIYVTHDQTEAMTMGDRLKNYISKSLWLGIRPEDIYDSDSSNRNNNAKIDVQLEVVEPMGNEIFLYFTIDDSQFIARIPAREKPEPNAKRTLSFDLGKLYFFDIESEKSI